MDVSRRVFLLAGLGFAVAGCASSQGVELDRPGPEWPTAGPPRPSGNPDAGTGGRAIGAAPVEPPPLPSSIKPIPRSAWTRASVMGSRVYAMGPVRHITVHHEGFTAVWFSDQTTTAKRLDSIRRSHIERLGAGDIGYHFVIDRAGRLWQGRDLRLQGAHVKNHNENNIGVMVLGNFDLQRPTDQQVTTLRATLIALQQSYKVPINHVYTHQELGPTECPGNDLQGRMVWLRRNGLA